MKRFWQFVSCIMMTVLLAGCSTGKEPDTSKSHIYYVNAEGTALIEQGYNLEGDTVEAEIKAVLKDMKKESDSIDYKSAFPEKLEVTDWNLDDKKLSIYFNTEYGRMDAATEVLLRAAVVQSLTQIAGIEYVDFYIEGEPLKDKNGNVVGSMRSEDFIKNTGSSLHTYQVANLRLYFANEKGDKLISREVSVRYNSNMSIEKLIVEQLIKGPAMEGAHQTIPSETKLLGVSVKDHICYVNFDEGFLGTGYTAAPDLTIYSLVNSIVDAGTASQVQISINGENDVRYQATVDLSKPFSRNQDIVEETKK